MVKEWRNSSVNRDKVQAVTMEAIEQKLGLSRESVVAIALFAGCDYDRSGVPNVGITHAVICIKKANSLCSILRHRALTYGEKHSIKFTKCGFFFFFSSFSLRYFFYPRAVLVPNHMTSLDC